MLEGQFNHVLVKSLLSLGIFAYKTADRFQLGVPDIYITKGTWIEGKVSRLGAKNVRTNMYDLMSPAQKTFARLLTGGGDTVLIAIRVERPKVKPRLVIVPFVFLEVHQSMDRITTDCYPEIKVEKRYDLTAFFNKDYPNHVNPNI